MPRSRRSAQGPISHGGSKGPASKCSTVTRALQRATYEELESISCDLSAFPQCHFFRVEVSKPGCLRDALGGLCIDRGTQRWHLFRFLACRFMTSMFGRGCWIGKAKGNVEAWHGMQPNLLAQLSSDLKNAPFPPRFKLCAHA